MKRLLFVIALVIALGLALPARAVEIGLLPQEKIPVILDTAERNPFGMRNVKISEAVVKSDGQESQIREVLTSLPVGGVVGTPPGMKVLLGSMPLKVGRKVPAVIPDQGMELLVKEISEKQIVLVFLENDDSETDRKVVIPVSVKPAVRFTLGSKTGTTGAKGGDKAKLGGTIQADEAVETKQ